MTIVSGHSGSGGRDSKRAHAANHSGFGRLKISQLWVAKSRLLGGADAQQKAREPADVCGAPPRAGRLRVC